MTDETLTFSGGGITHLDTLHTLDPVEVSGGASMSPSPSDWPHDPPCPDVPEPDIEALVMLGITAAVGVWLIRGLRNGRKL